MLTFMIVKKALTTTASGNGIGRESRDQGYSDQSKRAQIMRAA